MGSAHFFMPFSYLFNVRLRRPYASGVINQCYSYGRRYQYNGGVHCGVHTSQYGINASYSLVRVGLRARSTVHGGVHVTSFIYFFISACVDIRNNQMKKNKGINRVVRWRLVNSAVKIVAEVPVISIRGRIVVFVDFGYGTRGRRGHRRLSPSAMMGVL
jgi:hypothetical protein